MIIVFPLPLYLVFAGEQEKKSRMVEVSIKLDERVQFHESKVTLCKAIYLCSGLFAMKSLEAKSFDPRSFGTEGVILSRRYNYDISGLKG